LTGLIHEILSGNEATMSKTGYDLLRSYSLLKI